MESNESPSPVAEKPLKKPRVLRYFLVFMILVIVWVVLLELWIRPLPLITPGFPMALRAILYILPPFLVVLAAYIFSRLRYRRLQRKRKEEAALRELAEQRKREEEDARQAALRAQKCFSLEVIGLGVSVESLRQGELWDALHDKEKDVLSGDDSASSADGKAVASQEREAGALKQALAWLSEDWPIPAFLAGPRLGNGKMEHLLESNLVEALKHESTPGRKMRVVECIHDDHPVILFQRVFDFFDRNEDVPAVLVVAEDGDVLRNGLRPDDAPELIHDGPNTITESVVAFVLARRDRLEGMRAYIQGTPSNEDLRPFWEREAPRRHVDPFIASHWLPQAWPKKLLDQCLQLPLLGRLHRPQLVSYLGDHGLMGQGSRTNALTDGWKAALESLENTEPLTHLVHDHGAVEQGGRLSPLCLAVESTDPDFDIFDDGVDIHAYLGDTGAASPFLGLAIAILARDQEDGLGASVSLRQPDGASILIVSEK